MATESKLIIRHLFPATCAELFAAWTDPESMKAWMCPAPGITLPRVEIDLRVGGAFRIEMQSVQGLFVHTGVYQEITPPTRLVFTWQSSATNHRDTLVTVELYERPEGAELVLTHSDLPDQVSVSRHEDGWKAILATLANWRGQQK